MSRIEHTQARGSAGDENDIHDAARGTPRAWQRIAARMVGAAPALLWLVLLVIVALPMAFIVLQAIFPSLADGRLTHPFGALPSTLGALQTWVLLGTTIRLGVTVAVAATVLGTVLGAVRGLFALPFARVWDVLFLVPFLIPPYLAALSWMLLLQPAGYLQQLTGLHPGDALFSFTGMVFVMTMTTFPVVYFAVSRAFAQIGGRLADVARVHGASPSRAFRHVTLPLALPAIAASALLAFTMSVEEFGAPAALGARAGVGVLVTAIESRFSDWPIDLPGASVLSLLLAGLAIGAFTLQQRTLSGRDVSVENGKPVSVAVRTLGAWRWPVTILFASCAACATAAPLGAILATAVSRTLSGGLQLSNLTLAHFAILFSQGEDGLSAILTSAGLAAATSVVTAVLGLACAWYAVRSTLRGRATLDALSLLPHALPGVVVAVGLILAWNQRFWPATPYGTWFILLLSYSCLMLPYPVRYAGTALRQSGASLEAAARVHGATAAHAAWRITLPLVAPSLAAASMIVFAIASRELVTSLLLAPSGLQTVSIFVWRQFEQGSIGDGMAMGLVSILVSAALLSLASRLTPSRDG
ncbi:ABC transporter permease [Robbsia andropogonis]|nr:iron ABC transporter permease [Robbsia andropogonis]